MESGSSASSCVGYYSQLSVALSRKGMHVVYDWEKIKSCNFELHLTYHQQSRIQIYSTPPPQTVMASFEENIIPPQTAYFQHQIPLEKIQSTRDTKRTIIDILRGTIGCVVKLKEEDLKRIVDSVGSTKPLWQKGSPSVVVAYVDLCDMNVTQVIMPKDALIRQKLTCPIVASTCTICLEDFSRGAVVIKTRCNHPFHESCIARWLAKSGTCPLCRAHLHHI